MVNPNEMSEVEVRTQAIIVRSWARWVRSTASWVASGRSGRDKAFTVDIVWLAYRRSFPTSSSSNGSAIRTTGTNGRTVASARGTRARGSKGTILMRYTFEATE